MAVPPEVLSQFVDRRDNQIGGLELLSSALGLSTWETLLADRHVDLYSDNSGAEHGMRKGSARPFDHCSLVHVIWKRAAQLKLSLWVRRVPTDDNIGDPPSREDFELLREIGIYSEPCLHPHFRAPGAWSALSLRNWLA